MAINFIGTEFTFAEIKPKLWKTQVFFGILHVFVGAYLLLFSIKRNDPVNSENLAIFLASYFYLATWLFIGSNLVIDFP